MGSITKFSYILDSLVIQLHVSKYLTQDKTFWTGTPYNRDVFSIQLTAPDRTTAVCEMKTKEQGFWSDLI